MQFAFNTTITITPLAASSALLVNYAFEIESWIDMIIKVSSLKVMKTSEFDRNYLRAASPVLNIGWNKNEMMIIQVINKKGHSMEDFISCKVIERHKRNGAYLKKKITFNFAANQSFYSFSSKIRVRTSFWNFNTSKYALNIYVVPFIQKNIKNLKYQFLWIKSADYNDKFGFQCQSIVCVFDFYMYTRVGYPWDFISWNEASDICEHRGGSLPILRSKIETEELISWIIKSVNFMEGIEGIYIGAYSIKVSFWVTPTHNSVIIPRS